MSSSSFSSPEMAAASSTGDSINRFSYADATHDEVLEDLSSRFILNLPDEELSSLERICFQVEQAHWYYEDFIREENPTLPSLHLKKFSEMLFHACPLLHHWSHDHEQAFNTFMQYKTRVPVCGAIMLNSTWDKCVLVKGWKSSSGWGFPKGKINEDEPPATCAVREVLEETGYNLADQIDPQNVIEMSIKEQKVSLFIVPGVPEDFPFKTKTRKEISKIEWFRLIDLPTWKRNKQVAGKFYLISPFIGSLKAFINERKPRANARKGPKGKKQLPVDSSQIRKAQEIPRITDHETAQESSSQASSAENGEPLTPSPQYTESTINPVSVVANDPSGILSGSLDPHFARLLSSLTLSASGGHEMQPEVSAKVPSREHKTPVPVTILSHALPSVSESQEEPDWSSSVPSRLSTEKSVDASPISGAPNSVPQETQRPSLRSVESSSSLKAVNIASLRSPQNGADKENGRHLSPAPSRSTAASPIPSAMSPRSTSSRRMSATADISPYLTRPTEIPTSAKKLKQLALLESIADESARMTPMLAARAAAATPALPAGTAYPPPLPPASVPPHAMMPYMMHNQNDLGVLYSSIHGHAGPLPPMFNAGPGPMHSGGYPLRSRTSQAFHRYPMQSPSGSMSMTQDRLLALMNGAGGPSPIPATSYPPPPIQVQYPPPLHNPTTGPGSIPMYHQLPPQMGFRAPPPVPLHPYQTSHPVTSPFAAHAQSAPNPSAFNLSPKIAPNTSANALLSILNGSKPAQSVSNIATVPTMNT